MEKNDHDSRHIDTKSEQTEITELATVVETISDSRTVMEAMEAATQLTSSSAIGNRQHRILKPGTLIKNRFKLEQEIGHGGMGVVYTARDLRKEEMGDEDSIIAIKLLTQKLKSYPKALRMLQQETKKSQGLAHPNIVTVYDFDRDGDMFYMTMEYLTGQTLKDYLKTHEDNPHTLKSALPIIRDMVSGLSYAHQKSIIHSDLKPANVFLTEAGVTKILDFGIARAMMEPEVAQSQKKTEQSSPQDAPENHAEKLVGLTPNFASPEMFAGEPPAPGDDIYALACITYYLLAGKHPYNNVPANEAKEKKLVPGRIDGLNDRQWSSLLKSLELDGTKRINNADEFLTGLLPKKREKWRMAALGTLLLTLLTIAYFSFRPTPEFDLFIDPPPEQAMSESLRSQVDEALELAEVHMLVGRLVSPPGSNALDKYNEVLEIHAFNRKAISGLKKILNMLSDQAEKAISAGELEEASALIDTGLSVYTKHKKLLALQNKLKFVK